MFELWMLELLLVARSRKKIYQTYVALLRYSFSHIVGMARSSIQVYSDFKNEQNVGEAVWAVRHRDFFFVRLKFHFAGVENSNWEWTCDWSTKKTETCICIGYLDFSFFFVCCSLWLDLKKIANIVNMCKCIG